MSAWWVPVSVAVLWVLLVRAGERCARESVARRAARFVRVASSWSRPVVSLLRSTRHHESAGVKFFEDHVRGMIAASEELDADCRSVIEGAFSISHSSVGDVMIPRQDVFTVRADASGAQARAAMCEAGFSRAFVVENSSLSSVVGLVHVKELCDDAAEVRAVARDVVVLAVRTKVLSAIRTMQRERVQLALVADEYGELRGVVAMEDLLEELVGEIYDESDEEETVAWEEGCLRVAGRETLLSLRRHGVDLGPCRSRTLSGLMQERLGRMARVGDSVEHGAFRVEVTAVDGLTVTSAVVTRCAA